jgi:hypothetical protein
VPLQAPLVHAGEARLLRGQADFHEQQMMKGKMRET